MVSNEKSPAVLGNLVALEAPVEERQGLASWTAGQNPHLGRSWSKMSPGLGEAESPTVAVRRLPGAAGQGPQGCGAAAGGAG